MSKDTIRKTFTAPTEVEVAVMISALVYVPWLQNTARCLAFERDTLKRERDKLADALEKVDTAIADGIDRGDVDVNAEVLAGLEDGICLARKIIAAKGGD